MRGGVIYDTRIISVNGYSKSLMRGGFNEENFIKTGIDCAGGWYSDGGMC